MWSMRRVSRTGSTNADVAAAARSGVAEGMVLVADHQDAGRGRLGRSWAAPAGTSLAASYLLRPDDVPQARWPWLPLLAGVAVAEAIEVVVDTATASLKWPNDVLIDGSKVAGILVERVDGANGLAAVVGVGVNVSQTATELPPGAVSLRLAAEQKGHSVAAPERDAVLAVLTDRLFERYSVWRTAAAAEPLGEAVSELVKTYTARCDTVGRQVRVEVPGGRVVRGRAMDVDDAGRLVVATAAGFVKVSAGDVVHVRPS